ncbi:winged helix-turn-helix domain-containing protein [Prevotella sp. KH2C16]|uniref:winged helix-turn-helix domain-containing protein n=1 Tax=Prevotella sp. KH2C16 TaxID=1855325 RepID=UPI0008EE6290|nr:winged helix-turn-helix domain-containing protein [Prevotella sp. KH2C16]SFG03519.1 Transcriptional regulatory protein, C terminal [Prevotella sp. KH2C16]
MKPIYAIVVFLGLSLSAALSSLHSYKYTEESLVADMNQALAKTLAKKTEAWITPDTIHDYRQSLKIDALRRHSIVYYALDDRTKGLRSSKMKWQSEGKSVEFQGYANCSMATIWGLSDQRLPLLFLLLAASWMSFCIFRQHKRYDEMGHFCSLTYSEADNRIYNLRHEPVNFTPMQEQLVRMFLESDGLQLSKQEICDALWPKKPDASSTLYTLVKRLKPILKREAGLTIVSDRGRDYRLEKE